MLHLLRSLLLLLLLLAILPAAQTILLAEHDGGLRPCQQAENNDRATRETERHGIVSATKVGDGVAASGRSADTLRIVYYGGSEQHIPWNSTLLGGCAERTVAAAALCLTVR